MRRQAIDCQLARYGSLMSRFEVLAEKQFVSREKSQTLDFSGWLELSQLVGQA